MAVSITNINTALLILCIFHASHCLMIERKLCADKECQTRLSTGVARLAYNKGELGYVSFKQGAKVEIYGKECSGDKKNWYLKVNGEYGFAPSNLIRENSLEYRDPKECVEVNLEEKLDNLSKETISPTKTEDSSSSYEKKQNEVEVKANSEKTANPADQQKDSYVVESGKNGPSLPTQQSDEVKQEYVPTKSPKFLRPSIQTPHNQPDGSPKDSNILEDDDTFTSDGKVYLKTEGKIVYIDVTPTQTQSSEYAPPLKSAETSASAITDDLQSNLSKPETHENIESPAKLENQDVNSTSSTPQNSITSAVDNQVSPSTSEVIITGSITNPTDSVAEDQNATPGTKISATPKINAEPTATSMKNQESFSTSQNDTTAVNPEITNETQSSAADVKSPNDIQPSTTVKGDVEDKPRSKETHVSTTNTDAGVTVDQPAVVDESSSDGVQGPTSVNPEAGVESSNKVVQAEEQSSVSKESETGDTNESHEDRGTSKLKSADDVLEKKQTSTMSDEHKNVASTIDSSAIDELQNGTVTDSDQDTVPEEATGASNEIPNANATDFDQDTATEEATGASKEIQKDNATDSDQESYATVNKTQNGTATDFDQDTVTEKAMATTNETQDGTATDSDQEATATMNKTQNGTATDSDQDTATEKAKATTNETQDGTATDSVQNTDTPTKVTSMVEPSSTVSETQRSMPVSDEVQTDLTDKTESTTVLPEVNPEILSPQEDMEEAQKHSESGEDEEEQVLSAEDIDGGENEGAKKYSESGKDEQDEAFDAENVDDSSSDPTSETLDDSNEDDQNVERNEGGLFSYISSFILGSKDREAESDNPVDTSESVFDDASKSLSDKDSSSLPNASDESTTDVHPNLNTSDNDSTNNLSESLSDSSTIAKNVDSEAVNQSVKGIETNTSGGGSSETNANFTDVIASSIDDEQQQPKTESPVVTHGKNFGDNEKPEHESNDVWKKYLNKNVKDKPFESDVPETDEVVLPPVNGQQDDVPDLLDEQVQDKVTNESKLLEVPDEKVEDSLEEDNIQRTVTKIAEENVTPPPVEEIPQDVTFEEEQAKGWLQTISDFLPEWLLLSLEGGGVSSRVIALTVITGALTLILLISIHAIQTQSTEFSLKAKLCQFDQQLFSMTTERNIMKDELITAKEKVANLEQSLLETRRSVSPLQAELDDEKKSCIEMKNTIGSLEKELTSATEAGLELNEMLSGYLTSQNQDENLQEAIEGLQQQLNSQHESMHQLHTDLDQRNSENKELSSQVKNLTKLREKFENKSKQLSKDLEHLKETCENTKIRLESELKESSKLQAENTTIKSQYEENNRQLRSFKEEFSNVSSELTDLRQTSRASDKEIESLKEAINSVDVLKSFEDEDMTSEQRQETIQKLIQVAKLKSSLNAITEEKELISIKYKNEVDAHKEKEDEVLSMKGEYMNMERNLKAALNDKEEAETKLEILSKYFKEKEAHLQKELGLQEVKVQHSTETAENAGQKAAEVEQNISLYKKQYDTLKKEMDEMERSYKNQIAVQEKKAHENWLAARAAERKLDDMKTDSGILRNKLTLIEQEKATILSSVQNQSEILKPNLSRNPGQNGEMSGNLYTSHEVASESVLNAPSPVSQNSASEFSGLESPRGRFMPVDKPDLPPIPFSTLGMPMYEDRGPLPPLGMPPHMMGPMMPPPSFNRRSPPPYDRRSHGRISPDMYSDREMYPRNRERYSPASDRTGSLRGRSSPRDRDPYARRPRSPEFNRGDRSPPRNSGRDQSPPPFRDNRDARYSPRYDDHRYDRNSFSPTSHLPQGQPIKPPPAIQREILNTSASPRTSSPRDAQMAVKSTTNSSSNV